jgi:hypothetical protein
MNYHLLNGIALNGGIRTLVLATAAILCSASGSATALRLAQGSSAITAQAEVVSAGVRTQNPQAFIAGAGSVFPNVTHTQVARTNLSGTSAILAAVLRKIEASSSCFTGVDIIAVIASTQGAATVAPTSNLVGQATRIQLARSTLSNTGLVTLSVAPVITRKPTVLVSGTAVVRGEPNINNSAPAYFDVVGSANVVATALCSRIGEATFSGQSTSQAKATKIQPGRTVAGAFGSAMTAEPFIKNVPIAHVHTYSYVTATAFLARNASASLASSASMSGATLQKHASACSPVCLVQIDPASSVKSLMSASISSSSEVTAVALRIAKSNVLIDGSTQIVANANAKVVALASVTPTANLTGSTEDLNTRRVTTSATLVTSGNVLATANANVRANATNAASATVSATSEALNIRRVSAQSVVAVGANIVASNSMKRAAGVSLLASGTLTGFSEQLNRRSVLMTADLSVLATVVGRGNTNSKASASLSNTGTFVATAESLNTRRVLANSASASSASLEGFLVRIVQSAMSASGSASIQCAADVIIRQAVASVGSSANFVVTGLVIKKPVVAVGGSASVAPNATRTALVTQANPILITGSVLLLTDTIANPTAVDPEERTFTRPFVSTDYVRPFIETEYKRAA